jgi:hypothetical protein
MNIKDLNFQNNVGKSSQMSGGQRAFAHNFDLIEQRFQSLTGQVVGTFNASSDVTAIGTNEANVSFLSNYSGESVNKVNIGYSTTTSGFATTPGS